MSDMGELFRDLRDEGQALRAMWGVDCPGCRLKEPKRIPTCMLPGQRCKVCGHRDPRPRLTDEQRNSAMQALKSRGDAPEGTLSNHE